MQRVRTIAALANLAADCGTICGEGHETLLGLRAGVPSNFNAVVVASSLRTATMPLLTELGNSVNRAGYKDASPTGFNRSNAGEQASRLTAR